MIDPLACDHSRRREVRRVSVPCPVCREAGLADYLVVGRGLSCPCGWSAVRLETGRDHEASFGHCDALDILGRRTALEHELSSLRARVEAAKTELAALQSSYPDLEAEQAAQLKAATAEARAELASIRGELRAARSEATTTLKAARSKAERILREARDQADAAHSEVASLRDQATQARSDYDAELEQLALRREDRRLWDASPEETVAHFGYLEDADARTDYAIAVLAVRGEDPREIARLLHVGPARVDSVLRGAGSEDSVLERVRVGLGPRPDGWAGASPRPAPLAPDDNVPERAQRYTAAGARPAGRPAGPPSDHGAEPVTCQGCGQSLRRDSLPRHRSRCVPAGSSTGPPS